MSLFQHLRQLVQPTQTELSNLHGQLGKEIVARRLPTTANTEIALGCFACKDSEVLMQGKAPPSAYLVHRGPYTLEILPQVDVPELALRLQLVIDQLENHVAEARFALFLRSEDRAEMSLAELASRIQDCINTQLAQGYLLIETCPSATEWQNYRALLEKMLFTRFGFSLENCLPVDLAEQIDYASQLIAQENAPHIATAAKLAETEVLVAEPISNNVNTANAAKPSRLERVAVSRRMFLELPTLCREWRLLPWPSDLANYARLQKVAQRMDLLEARYASPPADLQLAQAQQLAITLEQAWALLARLQLASATQLSSHMLEIEALCTAWEAASDTSNEAQR